MVRITRFLLPILILTIFSVSFASAQNADFKNFASFRNIVPGVDFFASDRQTVASYEAAAAEAVEQLKTLLGEDLPKGAVFICTNLAQRDSLYEPVVIRRGYSWALITVTPEVRMQEQLERIKSQIGDNIPEEIRQRMSNPPREAASSMDRQAATAMAKNIAYAVLQTMLNDENFQFRSSRVDDVGKSPLQDWIDVAVGAYASGDRSAITYLRENFDMAFPLEDVLFMARPFVASTGNRRNVGQGTQIMINGNQEQGVPKSKSDGGAAQQRVLPKDEQDQRLFDGQSIAFFDYFMEKFGIEKMRELIAFVREKNESWNYVTRPDVLGRDFIKIESDLNEWLAKQPVAAPSPKLKVQQ